MLSWAFWTHDEVKFWVEVGTTDRSVIPKPSFCLLDARCRGNVGLSRIIIWFDNVFRYSFILCDFVKICISSILWWILTWVRWWSDGLDTFHKSQPLKFCYCMTRYFTIFSSNRSNCDLNSINFLFYPSFTSMWQQTESEIVRVFSDLYYFVVKQFTEFRDTSSFINVIPFRSLAFLFTYLFHNIRD